MTGCEDIIGHAHHSGNVQGTKKNGSTDHGNHQTFAAELESPRMTPQLLLLLLDPNDTPAVAVTASTSCAVSVPTTHGGNEDVAPELFNKKAWQVGQAALAIRRPRSRRRTVGTGAGAPRK